ncbi:UDP-N-acetylglucosamine transferase subunit Alg13p [Monosporozyma unispora]|nr:N-acetylglucosaminyldiphosphodolichol N-acetylglucosaminyltransferase catalytic subunit alg13 [Kazachstania unispora]
MNKRLFVTCGATVPFSQLIKCIISPEFVKWAVKKFHYTEFVIQYGIGYTEPFTKAIHELYGEVPTTSLQNNVLFGCPQAQEYKLLDGKLVIHGLEYSTKIQDLIEDSSLVISHAGTGSILDTLRNKTVKPLIVVVNNTLMDNHQEQIASRFQEMGYIIACHTQTSELTAALTAVEEGSIALTPFPHSHNDHFAQLLITTSLH